MTAQRLYRWQQRALDAWRAAGHRGIVEAVTGAGKTRLGLEACRTCLESGRRCVVIVPGLELGYQWQNGLRAAFPEHDIGMLGGESRANPERVHVLVATVNLARSTLLANAMLGGLLIADECHRYGSDVNRLALASGFDWRLGLSATHERLDGLHQTVVEPYFGGVVYRYPYESALDDGVICPFNVALIAVSFSDEEREQYEYLSSKVKKARLALLNIYGLPAEPFGEFIKAVNNLRSRGNKLEAIAAGRYLSAFNRRRSLLAETSAKLDGLAALLPAFGAARRAIVFTQTVAAAQRVRAELVDLGVDAENLHSLMDAEARRDVMRRYREAKLHTIVAPQMLDEGIDVPDADFGVIVAASRQRRQMIQRMGRCLRLKSGTRHARFAILYVQGTGEDPAYGAHEAFLDDIVGPADAVKHFDLYHSGEEICEFLSSGRRAGSTTQPAVTSLDERTVSYE